MHCLFCVDFMSLTLSEYKWSYKCTGECYDYLLGRTCSVVKRYSLAESFFELRQYSKPDHGISHCWSRHWTFASLTFEKNFGKETSIHVWKEPFKLKQLFPGTHASMNKLHCRSLYCAWLNLSFFPVFASAGRLLVGASHKLPKAMWGLHKRPD